MDKASFYNLLTCEDGISTTEINEISALIHRYPYFQTARLARLKNLAHDEVLNPHDFASELSSTALLCADRRRLFYMMSDNRYAHFLHAAYPDANKGKDRTEELLDSFLETIAEDSTVDTKQDIIASDYLSYIESIDVDNSIEVETNGDTQLLKHHDIIDGFLEKAETREIFTASEKNEDTIAQNGSESAENENENDVFLTETLARIYIKQRKYEQALAIIRRLSLNFPKKSVYFADQIRFLEYLILNEKNKK